MKAIKKTNLTLSDVLTEVVSSIVNEQVAVSDIQTDSSLNVKRNSINVTCTGVECLIVDGETQWTISFTSIDGVNYKIEQFGKTGLFIVPKIGSECVLDVVDTEYIISKTTDINNIEMSGEEYISIKSYKTLDINSDAGMFINCGEEINFSGKTYILKSDNFSDDGMVMIQELTTKLNKLVDEIKALKNDYAAHTHPFTGGSTSAPTVPFVGLFSSFNKNDYENTKIKI